MRFCLLGFAPTLIVAIAKAALASKELADRLLVKINPELDSDLVLPPYAHTKDSIIHWRHCPLPENCQAVLLATTQSNLQFNIKSVEKITKIETDVLRSDYERWIDQLDVSYSDKEITQFTAALRGVNETHTARTIEMFASFVLSVSKQVGQPIPNAVDRALNTLHLPNGAGDFKKVPTRKQSIHTQWSMIFRDLNRKVRPLLYLENDRGDYIFERVNKNYLETIDNYSSEQRIVIENFLGSDPSADLWNVAQQHLVEQDWKLIKGIFDGVQKETTPELHILTKEFLIDEYGIEFDDDPILDSKLPNKPDDRHYDFYKEYRERISKKRKLTVYWEKYLYQNPRTYSNVLVGIVETLHQLRESSTDSDITEQKFVVRISQGSNESTWEGINTSVARYLALSLHGLGTLLGDNATLDLGNLRDFYIENPRDKFMNNTSLSRKARTIKFEVEIDPNGLQEILLFYWAMPAGVVATSMYDDMNSILEVSGEGERKFDSALLATANISRQSTSSKGALQKLSLSDVNTITDAEGHNNGRLISQNHPESDLEKGITDGIDNLDGIVEAVLINDLKNAFSDFSKEYTTAIKALVNRDGAGLASSSLIRQAEKYSDLLSLITEKANNDTAREEIWRLILSIGTAQFKSGPAAAIITPWHPLRLAEMAIKARLATDIMNQLIITAENDISRADLLLGQYIKDLTSTFYPEQCVCQDSNGKSVLLTATETNCGYTLCELAGSKAGSDAYETTDLVPRLAARIFSKIGADYLKLQPHQRSNFSMVLFDFVSKTLPSEVATELSMMVERENDLNCELLLTHSDSQQNRRIYEQQNAATSFISETFRTSESTRSFLSQLHVGFLDAPDLSEDTIARPSDIVALQDVVSNISSLVWKNAPSDEYPALLGHIPTRWSKRRPVNIGDKVSTVYLTSPSQPLVSQVYLNTLHSYLEGSNARKGNVIPAYELSFEDKKIREILRYAHQLGEWVINFDELVDHKLLQNSGVQVIRQIKEEKFDRRITVSTTVKSALLLKLLEQRVMGIDDSILIKHPEAISKFIEAANQLSGQVVMRAARHGPSANELLGIVLSKEAIKLEIGNSNYPIGWFCLDDYVSWFGQQEEQIADIMALAPRLDDDGNPILDVVISEAKFVSATNRSVSEKKSIGQLIETVNRISRALDNDEGQKRIDRKLWLNKLGDFMIDGIEPFKPIEGCSWDLFKWSMELRNDNVPINLRGISHVFLHDGEDVVRAILKNNKGATNCSQCTFSKTAVSAAIKAFVSGNQFPKFDFGKTAIKSADYVKTDVSKRNDHPEQQNETTSDDQSVAIVAETETGTNTTTTQLNEGNQVTENPFSPTEGQLDEVSKWINVGNGTNNNEAVMGKWLEETKTSLMMALRGYEMSAEPVGEARLTPNTALYRFKGADNLTVPKVERRKQELLTSHKLRVTSVGAEPGEVTIKIARPERTILHLKDLWKRRKFSHDSPNSNTNLLLGECENDGKLLYLNLEKGFGGFAVHAPHTLIAGETGSGKGVLVNTLLLDICATNSPVNAQLRMIDPKSLDYPWLRNMPHLHEKEIISNQNDAIETFKELVGEMESRTKILSEASVNSLSDYNKSRDAEIDKLPRIWLFHDEFADWMIDKDYWKAVEQYVTRLGLKGRAAGINLVMITQRPDKDALPMQLRANLSNRLCLKVADKLNSALVIGEHGAENLLGNGHLAAKLSGGPIIYAQTPFIENQELAQLASIISTEWEKRQGM